VAVEKLEISGISGNFGDRKCLAKQEKVVCRSAAFVSHTMPRPVSVFVPIPH
jgi:hypothetical protein